MANWSSATVTKTEDWSCIKSPNQRKGARAKDSLAMSLGEDGAMDVIQVRTTGQ